MILNIYKKGRNQVCPTSFSESFNWSCTLLNFICRLESPIRETGIYCFETDLIFRESNYHRVLFYIHLTHGTRYFTYTPTLRAEYKLRLHDVSTAEFELLRIDGTPIKLLDYCLTFDIGRYARF